MSDYVYIFDTTLRDGEQSPGCSMNVQEKLQVARMLDELGVDVIEAGFPAASDGDFASVKAVGDLGLRATICGLARTRRGDIEAVARALDTAQRKRLHIFIATSPIHREHKLKMSQQQIIDEMCAAVAHGRQWFDDIEVTAEDAGRTEIDYLTEYFQAAIEAGAKVLNVPDTVGYVTPGESRQLYQRLSEQLRHDGSVILSCHNHNDLGLAVANALGAIEGGARQVECTINGIGERAGNCSLEEVVMALRTRHDRYGVRTGIDTTRLYPASRVVTAVTGSRVQPNKAIVGRNAFAHEAGIHQDGVLSRKMWVSRKTAWCWASTAAAMPSAIACRRWALRWTSRSWKSCSCSSRPWPTARRACTTRTSRRWCWAPRPAAPGTSTRSPSTPRWRTPTSPPRPA
jgi:2-isopropylmalate synthase